MSDFLFSEIHKTSHYSVFWNGGIQRWKKSMHDYVGYHKHGWVVAMASFSEVVRGTTSFSEERIACVEYLSIFIKSY